MQYELTHDTIARQIFEKASTEARTRRKVERFIRERYQAYEERGAKLTQDDLDYIQPHLASVRIEPEVATFIRQAKEGLKRSQRRRRRVVMAIILGLSALAAVAIWQWQTALANQKMVLKQQDKIQGQADSLLLAGSALGEALKAANMAKDTAETRRLEAEQARNRAELLKLLAEQQRQLAEDQRGIAEEQTTIAEEARSQVQINLELAEAATVRASEQEGIARNNANDAKQAEAEALRLATSSELCATAISLAKSEPRMALDSAWKACQITAFQHSFALTTLNDIFTDPNHQFYRHRFEDTASSQYVQCIAVSSDENLLALGRVDGSILLLNANNLQLLHTFKGHSSTIRSLDFSSDGRYLLSGAREGEVQVWDLTSNSQLLNLMMESAANAVRFTAGDQKIVAVGDAGIAKSWQLNGQETSCLIQHNGIVQTIAKSPDQQLLATSDSNGNIKIWDAQATRLIKRIRPGGKDYIALAFSPNGRQLAAATEGGMVSIMNCSDWKILKQWQASTEVNSLAFSGDNQYLLVGQKSTSASSGFAQYHNVIAWHLQRELQSYFFGDEQRSIKGLCYLPKQDRFIYSSYNGIVKQWDFTLANRCPILPGGADDIAHTAVSANGLWYAAAEPATYGLHLWQTKPKIARKSLEMPLSLAQYWLEAIGFTRDQTQLLGASSDGMVYHWSLATRQLIAQFDIGEGDYERICFSDDMQWLAAMDASDNRIHIWNIERRQEETVLPGHQALVNDLTFSNDGTVLVSGDQAGEVIVWSIPGKQEITRISENSDPVVAVALSTDGTLAIGRKSGLNRWLLNGQKLAKQPSLLGVGDAIETLSFSNDGQWLAIGKRGQGTGVIVWNKALNQIVQTYQMNEKDYPRSLCFTPNASAELLIGGWNGTCRVMKNMIYTLENRMEMKVY